MNFSKLLRRKKNHFRAKKKFNASGDRSRIVVFRSNRYIYAQLVNVLDGTVIAAASSIEKDILKKSLNGKIKVAEQVGLNLAQRAKSKGYEDCQFDRNGFLYHGRVKALAEGARKGGLKF